MPIFSAIISTTNICTKKTHRTGKKYLKADLGCTQTQSSSKHFLCVISHGLIVISPQGENEAISQHGGLPQVAGLLPKCGIDSGRRRAWWLACGGSIHPGVSCLPTVTQIKHNIFKPKLVLKMFFKLLFYIILFYFTLTVISLKYAALPSKTGVRVLFKS